MPSPKNEDEGLDDELYEIENLSLPVLRSRLGRLSFEELAEQWENAPPETRRRMSHALDNEIVENLRTSNQNYKIYGKLKKSSKDDAENPEDEQRIPKKDYLDYQLSRIHREKIEDELDQIRLSIQQYFESSQERSQKRRQENVYVLVALGIISGFLTYYPKFNIGSSPFGLVATGSAIASAFFLFIKLNTVGNSPREGRLDKIADVAFRVAASGIFVIGVGAILVTTFSEQISQIPTVAAQILTLILTVLMTAFSWYNKMKQISDTPVTFNAVQDAMFSLASNDEEGDTQSLEDLIQMIEEYKKHASTEESLVKLKQRAEQIEGFSNSQMKEITETLDDLIEEKSKETKTEEELREMRMAELDEERESYRERVQELMEKSD
ncbi:hypothetical protein [Halomicrococcus sp. SG-WS-1]|uniref:hypothetical protein n=1 Tax=Halomicrococcus sp. SG-WS-1 TaxID=3439057 RepID=UPI003F78F539